MEDLVGVDSFEPKSEAHMHITSFCVHKFTYYVYSINSTNSINS